AHEIGHNWFYAAIATNEREYPWMDEGLNSYYDIRYHQWKYRKEGTLNIGKSSVGYNELQRLLLETHALQKTDQAIATPSEEFTDINYSLVAYYKTAQWLSLLQKQLGTEVFDEAMQTYYSLWKFKHPYPLNFKEVIEKVSEKDLSSAFQLLQNKGLLKEEQKSAIKFATPLKFSSITGNIQDPSKNLILFSPVAGFNTYDKVMFGPLITNYKLPPNKLQFLLAPLYAAGSKSFTGLGKLSYTFYPEHLFRTAKFFVNGSTFSMNEYVDEAGHKTITKFQKVVPGVKLVFKESQPRSTVKKTLQWKTFLLKEESFQFSFDTIISGVDTSILQVVTTPQQRSTIHQLQLMYENNRALYPFGFQLQVEQEKNFVRPTFTAEYFFNYARGGGLNVRLFGGKFIYTNGKTSARQFELQRYQLNMTGVSGYEDYTYSNYFIGRNKFEDFVSQQIMIRDGAFKVRTDLLASEIGKTDNWLMAANFNTTIPGKINPLSLLPFKIPLRLFVDVGTYAEAWKQNAENDRLLFDAGFHIPLLDEAVNVYIPVIYSKVYGDYYKSTFEKNRLIRTISFSIDLNKPISRITKQLHL
ncbi:MAG: M1 family aminopeptidase, partial [Chitinophagaceae bacterium]